MILFWCDASYEPRTGCAGIAVVAEEDGQYILHDTKRLMPCQDNNVGEWEAVQLAQRLVACLDDQERHRSVVVTDSSWVMGKWYDLGEYATRPPVPLLYTPRARRPVAYHMAHCLSRWANGWEGLRSPPHVNEFFKQRRTA